MCVWCVRIMVSEGIQEPNEEVMGLIPHHFQNFLVPGMGLNRRPVVPNLHLISHFEPITNHKSQMIKTKHEQTIEACVCIFLVCQYVLSFVGLVIPKWLIHDPMYESL